MPSIAGPVLDQTTPALARSWHATALSREVPSGPAATQSWLLGRPWCLARVPGSGLTAWADHCPHRLAPLSAATVEAGGILREDRSILERYDHECVPLDRTVGIHTRADRLSLAWRRLMADFVGIG